MTYVSTHLTKYFSTYNLTILAYGSRKEIHNNEEDMAAGIQSSKLVDHISQPMKQNKPKVGQSYKLLQHTPVTYFLHRGSTF